MMTKFKHIPLERFKSKDLFKSVKRTIKGLLGI